MPKGARAPIRACASKAIRARRADPGGHGGDFTDAPAQSPASVQRAPIRIWLRSHEPVIGGLRHPVEFARPARGGRNAAWPLGDVDIARRALLPQAGMRRGCAQDGRGVCQPHPQDAVPAHQPTPRPGTKITCPGRWRFTMLRQCVRLARVFPWWGIVRPDPSGPDPSGPENQCRSCRRT